MIRTTRVWAPIHTPAIGFSAGHFCQSIVPSHSGLTHSFAAFGLFCGSLLSVTLELELFGLPFSHANNRLHAPVQGTSEPDV